MLKLGTKNIKNLKLGDKTIFKGIKGGKTVYRNYPIFLDYIVFDGNSYIDTGIIPTNTTGSYVNYEYTKYADMVILGCRNAYEQTRFFIPARYRNYVNIGWGNYRYMKKDGSFASGSESTDFTTPENTTTEAWCNYLNSRVMRIKTAGVDVTSVQLDTLTFTPQYTMYLGCQNCYGTAMNYYTGKLRQCTITEGDAVIQDLRPAIDPCGVVCMYDMVTNKYFYNQGTGTLKAGGRFVESIVFDNSSTTKYDETSTCYINTGIQNQDGIWAEVTWKTTVQKRWLFGMGVNYNTDNFMFGHFTNANSFIGCGGISVNNKNPNNIMCADGKVHTATIKYDKYILDGVEAELSENDNTYEKFRDIYLGTTNYLNNADGRGFIGGVYNFKLYNNVNELIQDLRPYVDENGVACFKDVVTNTLFYNQGTGTLTYTDFERILYLESDRTNYIDTGFKPNQDTTVIITWSESSEINYGMTFFGARDSYSPTNAFVFWGASSGYWRDQYGNQNFTSTIPRDTKKHTLIKDKNKTYLDGELLKEHTYTEFNCSHNMYLFCINEGGVANYYGKVKIYSCLIYNNGEHIQELIPVKRSDGVKCLYDRVENKYYEWKVA